MNVYGYQFNVAIPGVGELLLKITLLLVLAWLAHFWMRKWNPRWRMLLWRGAVCAAALIPVFTAIAPVYTIPVSTLPAFPLQWHPAAFMQPDMTMLNSFQQQSSPSANKNDTDVSNTVISPNQVNNQTAASIIEPPALKTVILCVWSFGFVVMMLWLLRAVWWVGITVRKSVPVTDDLNDLVQQVAADLDCRSDILLRQSSQITSPYLCGWRKPVILLPLRVLAPDYRTELPAILAHEISHIKTHDVLWLTVILWFRALFWFHPLVWTIHKAHENACEAISDAVAAEYVGSAESYSKTLARAALELRAPQTTGGIAMVRQANIVTRLEYLKSKLNALPLSRKRLCFSCMIVCAFVAAIVMLHPQAVSIAQETEIGQSEKQKEMSTSNITLRRISDTGIPGAYLPEEFISPDGKFFLYINSIPYLYEFSTGNSKKLDNLKGLTYYSFSRDGKKLVLPDKDYQKLYIYELDSAEKTLIYENSDSNIYRPHFLPNGESVVVLTSDSQGNEEIALISTESGEKNTLLPLDRSAQHLGVSPDGEYILYTQFRSRGEKHDIFLYHIKSKRLTPLVENPAEDIQIGWVPNSNYVLFISERSGNRSLYAVEVQNDGTPGDTTLVLANIDGILPLRITNDGTLYFKKTIWENNVYIADLDEKTGKVVGKPKSVVDKPAVRRNNPDWSTDGKSISFVESHGKQTSIVLYDLNSKNKRMFSIHDLPNIDYPRWSPDNTSILFLNGVYEYVLSRSFHVLDLKSGESNSIISNKETKSYMANWWPNEHAVYYSTYKLSQTGVFEGWNHYKYNLEKKTEENIDLPLDAYPIVVSPNGSQIAYGSQITFQEWMKAISIKSLSGGEPKELFKMEKGYSPSYLTNTNTLAWSPDSQYIYFVWWKEADNGGMEYCQLWRVSAEGGKPEYLGIDMDYLKDIRVHPNGNQIAFSAGSGENELWVMENYLPKK